MDLPITPIFFKKLDIYQRLTDFEKDSSVKHTWPAEKVALIWAAGPDHQHIGSYVDASHLEQPLEAAVNKSLDDRSAPYALHRQVVLEALVVRGFVERGPNANFKFNHDGLLAGKILSDTKSLKNVFTYRISIFAWWVILGMAAIILISQAVDSLLNLLSIASYCLGSALFDEVSLSLGS